MPFKKVVLPVAGGLLFFTALIGASQAIVALNVALSPAVPWFPLAALVLAGVATWWANRRWPLRLAQPAGGRAYAVALLLTYAAVCLGVLESSLHGLIAPAPSWPDETLSTGFQFLYLLTLPIFAAVLAEVCFRGLIQTALEKVMPLWPMLLTIAVLNFLMHFYDPDQFSQVFRLLAPNLVWGWVTWRTQSIRPALAGHVAMNIGIAALQYGSENYGPGPFGDFSSSTLTLAAVSGVVALALGLVLIKGWGQTPKKSGDLSA